jgi:putative cardiolipin synthase
VGWGLFVRNDGTRPTNTQVIEAAIRNAHESVVMANAYFIPDEEQEKMMEAKLLEGVDFITYTNSRKSTRHSNVVRLMEGAIRRLLAARMPLMQRIRGEVHAKAKSVDHRVMAVTSNNLDGRSRDLDTQNGIFMDSPELAGEFNDDLKRQVVAGEYELIEHPTVPGSGPISWCARLLLSPLKGMF